MVTDMVPSVTLSVYEDVAGKRPFQKWFDGLDSESAVRITTALDRLRYGNTSRAKSLGGGAYELKMPFGPGYRVYFGWDGPALVILLAGGSKQRQQKDIKLARDLWAEFKERKRG